MPADWRKIFSRCEQWACDMFTRRCSKTGKMRKYYVLRWLEACERALTSSTAANNVLSRVKCRAPYCFTNSVVCPLPVLWQNEWTNRHTFWQGHRSSFFLALTLLQNSKGNPISDLVQFLRILLITLEIVNEIVWIFERWNVSLAIHRSILVLIWIAVRIQQI